MRATAALLLLLLTAALPAADIEVAIDGPETASGGFALIGNGPDDAVLRWRIDGPDGAADPLRLRDEAGHPVLVFMSPVNGRYRVVLTGQVPSDGLDPFGESVHVVTVGNVPPGPTPDPQPDPDDDDVEPTPDDKAPFPAKGLTVLFVIDDARKQDLSANQRAILWGTETRDLLNSRTIKGPDGKTNEWRIWYDNVDPTAAGEPWIAARKAADEPPDAAVKLVISNGKTGIVMPLNPEVTPAQFREILSKY